MRSAILVDGPYLSAALRAIKATVDDGLLARSLAERYAPVVRAIVYSGVQASAEVLRKIHEAGYEVWLAAQRPSAIGLVKGLDVQIAVDMARLSDSCDRMVLVSGDADFAPGVRAVVERGVAVEIVALATHLGQALRDAGGTIVDLMAVLADLSPERHGATPSASEAELWALKGIASEHRKDLRAAWAGILLERMLRELCRKHNLTIASNDGVDALNGRLVRAGVYAKLTQKKITVWADIRNNATHGQFENYSEQDVREMEAWVARFIQTHRA